MVNYKIYMIIFYCVFYYKLVFEKEKERKKFFVLYILFTYDI